MEIIISKNRKVFFFQLRTTIDQNGTVIGFDDYDPFGNVLPGRSLNLGTPNDLNKFTGHERDQEGGLDLDYMLARNYDSELGRFYSVDPLYNKFPAWSPYNYTMNNPLRFVDPTGMAAEDHEKYSSNSFVQSLINRFYPSDDENEVQYSEAVCIQTLSEGSKVLANGAIDATILTSEKISNTAGFVEGVALASTPVTGPIGIEVAATASSVQVGSDLVNAAAKEGKSRVNGTGSTLVGDVSYVFTKLGVSKAASAMVEKVSTPLIKGMSKVPYTKGKWFSNSSGTFLTKLQMNLVIAAPTGTGSVAEALFKTLIK